MLEWAGEPPSWFRASWETKITFRKPPPLSELLTDCWIWLGAATPTGYSRVTIKGKLYYLHRLSLAWKIKEDIAGYEAAHKCNRPPCFNPEHVFKATHDENLLTVSRGSDGRFKAIEFYLSPADRAALADPYWAMQFVGR